MFVYVGSIQNLKDLKCAYVGLSQNLKDLKEAWSFYRTISVVRQCWELEEPEGPKGRVLSGSSGRNYNLKDLKYLLVFNVDPKGRNAVSFVGAQDFPTGCDPKSSSQKPCILVLEFGPRAPSSHLESLLWRGFVRTRVPRL